MGVAVFVWEHVTQRRPAIRQETVPVLIWGLLFSLVSYFSIVYNDTYDSVFATYFVSMCVWLGGAYLVTYVLKKIHGSVTIKTVFQYLTWVCAGHCILAVIIDNSPVLAISIESVFEQPSLEYFEKNPRLYSIGVGFDTAGIRFSCVLLGCAYLIKNTSTDMQRNLYIALLLIIGGIGNMVSRTTAVGLAIACIYLLSTSNPWIRMRITPRRLSWFVGLGLLIVFLLYAGGHLYNTSGGFRRSFDYGFEGFINLYKEGRFFTYSSDLLVNSIGFILPDNTKTWLIGDGYFADPNDPALFYMGTDMGYIRFIFYCGVTGLAVFLAYFICCTYVLCKREKGLKLFFLCLFAIQLTVWVKIPTDIFCFYALLLLADGLENEREDCQSEGLRQRPV